MSEGVGGLSGGTPVSGAGPMKNPYGGLAVLLLSIAPQLLALVFLLLTPLSLGYVSVSPANFAKFAFDRNLLIIFTLPLAVIGVITTFVNVRGPQDYYGG